MCIRDRLRLLLPVAASICNDVDVDAKGRLPDRPLEPMLGEMKAHGVTSVSYTHLDVYKRQFI